MSLSCAHVRLNLGTYSKFKFRYLLNLLNLGTALFRVYSCTGTKFKFTAVVGCNTKFTKFSVLDILLCTSLPAVPVPVREESTAVPGTLIAKFKFKVLKGY
eukprot:SAG31_NODE_7231_length_1748_cov_14.900546_2_plen_101_part_00